MDTEDYGVCKGSRVDQRAEHLRVKDCLVLQLDACSYTLELALGAKSEPWRLNPRPLHGH